MSFVSSSKEKCALRTVSKNFDIVVKQKVVFAPVLTDYTLQAMRDLRWDHRVKEIQVRDLQIELPTTESDRFDCKIRQNRVTSISFYPAVSTKNKTILLNSFPQIQELRFIGSSCFPTCLCWDEFRFLQRLDVCFITLSIDLQ